MRVLNDLAKKKCGNNKTWKTMWEGWDFTRSEVKHTVHLALLEQRRAFEKAIEEYEERCVKELELGGGVEHLRLETEGKLFALATLKQQLGLLKASASKSVREMRKLLKHTEDCGWLQEDDYRKADGTKEAVEEK